MYSKSLSLSLSTPMNPVEITADFRKIQVLFYYAPIRTELLITCDPVETISHFHLLLRALFINMLSSISNLVHSYRGNSDVILCTFNACFKLIGECTCLLIANTDQLDHCDFGNEPLSRQ